MKKKFITVFLLAAVLSLFFFTCKEDEEESTDPVVESVTVSPPTAEVAHNGGEEFTAVVNGRNNPAQTVTWSVTGNAVDGTVIDEDGRLSVAANETATTLTVRAISTINTNRSGTAIVTVTAAQATVTGVTVSPSTASVGKGSTRHFTATVTGTNHPGQTVTWRVTGGGTGTSINATGWLTVSANETAATLIITAASTLDPTKSGTAAVTVTSIVTPTDPRILNPATQTTQLSNPSFTPITTNHGGGNKWLPAPSPYGYETWDEQNHDGSFTGTASFTWFGANQGGGAAFKADWNNPKDFLARVGYFWDRDRNGTSTPRLYTVFGNIYCGFNYTRSERYRGNFSYIGIYGWTRNPLIEYYIVEDNYGNEWRDTQAFINNFNADTLQGIEMQSYTLDGSVYKVYRKQRTGPSIAGNTTFTQFFSIRQTPRRSGTVSVTEHFKKWDEQGMTLGTMYECKFKVEVGGRETENPPPGTGWFDASFIQFYRAEDDGTIIEITP